MIAGNWKMNKTGPEAVSSTKELVELAQAENDVEVMIAPTHVALPLVADQAKGSNVHVGAQNLHFESKGAFTGEISAEMLKAAGAEYVLIGHSERRQLFNETDELISKKVLAAINAGLKPILCIGETEAEREAEKTFLVLDKQVTDGLKSSGLNALGHLILAYEPVWAIGTGKTASVEQVAEVHRHLRSLICSLYTEAFAEELRILYGGSVKPSNTKELMAIKDVDGALVGGASLEAKTFMEIVRQSK